MDRFWNKVNKQGPFPLAYTGLKTRCWLWTASCFPNGYGQFKYEGLSGAHRVAWVLRHKKHIPKGKDVCHKCDTKKCVRHLFLGTRKDNMIDCVNKQRIASGVKNGRAKLTIKIVATIRKRYATGLYSQDELAANFGVSQHEISSIVRMKIWASQ